MRNIKFQLSLDAYVVRRFATADFAVGGYVGASGLALFTLGVLAEQGAWEHVEALVRRFPTEPRAYGRRPLTFSLPENVLAQLTARAAMLGLSRPHYVRNVLTALARAGLVEEIAAERRGLSAPSAAPLPRP